MAIKFKARKVIKGHWTYMAEPINVVVAKKGETAITSLNVADFEEVKALKLGNKIYDIDKIEDDKIILKSEIEEDFEGMAIEEWSLPIIIRNSTVKNDMILENQVNFRKKDLRVVKPLRQCTKEIQANYLKDAKEYSNKVDIDMSTINIIMYDHEAEVAEKEKLNIRQELLGLVVNVDMDYSEDGVDLWKQMGVKKGNYVEVVERLCADVFVTQEDIDSFKLTLEGLAKGMEQSDVEKYVDIKLKELEMIKVFQEVRKNMTEEQFNEFVEGLQKQQEEALKNEHASEL